MCFLTWSRCNDPGGIVHLDMAMGEEQAINETFIAWAVTIGRIKEDNGSKFSISMH